MNGRSIHVGVTSFGDMYPGLADTVSCATDAERLAATAAAAGFTTSVLTGTVTTCEFAQEIKRAANELGADGCLLITFSGHGVGFDTDKGVVRGWCFSDDIFFRHGRNDDFGTIGLADVFVAVVSACCYSGEAAAEVSGGLTLPLRIVEAIYEQMKDRILAYAAADARQATGSVGPFVIEIAACALTETVPDGEYEDEPTPFVDALLGAVDDYYDSFATFMTALGRRAAANDLPEPRLLRPEPKSPEFEDLGPFVLSDVYSDPAPRAL